MSEKTIVKKAVKVIDNVGLVEMSEESILHTDDSFPFRTQLSFVKLIEYWQEKQGSGNKVEAILANAINEEVKKVPEFTQPIHSSEVLKKHRKLLDLLLAGFIPNIEIETYLAAAAAPFRREDFYRTPALEQLIDNEDSNYTLEEKFNVPLPIDIIRACCMILNKFYGQNINIDPQYILTVKPNRCATLRYFKTARNYDFIEIKKVKPLADIAQADIDRLFNNIYNVNLWLEIIPVDRFEFHGLLVTQFVDITEEEALSRLKHLLLQKHALVEKEDVQKLQDQLRIFFGLRELRLGITAVDYPLEFSVAHQYKIRHDFLADKYEQLIGDHARNSIYEKACRFNKSLLIEDLTKIKNRTAIEDDLIEQGLRSMMIIPLSRGEDRIIGLLEIGSPYPYELNSFRELKFNEIIGLFRMAIERGRDEIDNKIEAIIREEYTSLHPTVEWRFVEAAYDLLSQREFIGEEKMAQSIVFRDVYPLYGQADIVGSSIIRNEAIQADLLNNLNQVRQLLEEAHRRIGFPLIDQYILKLKKTLLQLEDGIQSNDESDALELIHSELHPFLVRLQLEDDALGEKIKVYFTKLDTKLGVIYDKRKAYEDSVAKINKTIGRDLEKAEAEAQQMLPHYFEKYKTDGVEYEIYVGQSLLKTDQFSPIHLRNLRLWQLITMCQLTCRVEELREKLPIPLTTAQLIFVYNTPISIRFRMDEKRFDVDGSYNVRYEIIKKRIDKALIEGTDERLTVSGKIAIVYTAEKDKLEYLEYCDYLLHKGYITDEIEELSLSALQGVQGLKAIRVTVSQNQL
ncbi:MAG: hypothetical protein AB8G22_20420 [Saprospiraceae bacterium]